MNAAGGMWVKCQDWKISYVKICYLTLVLTIFMLTAVFYIDVTSITRLSFGYGKIDENNATGAYPNTVVSLSSNKTLLNFEHNSTTTQNDEKTYARIRKYYEERLPYIIYNSTSAHVDIGPPLSSMLYARLSPQAKLILLWTPFFGIEQWLSNAYFNECPRVAPCIVTTNKSKLSESLAVILHPRDMPGGRKNLPTKHPPWQRWIYFIHESPWHMGINPNDFNNTFNWTSGHRRDTDIPLESGEFERRETPMTDEDYSKLLSKTMNMKTKLVSARISNCETEHTSRLSYIKELQKYIAMDFYGDCGDLKSPRNEKGDQLMKEYKFFLAFENANCRDYITEKFWLPLQFWSSVPVVMGAAPLDYRAIAPDHSYIHTEGFQSPRDLAEYLLLLDRNTHLYQNYFVFHKHWRPFRERNSMWCKVCSHVNDLSLPVKSYRNFKGWYDEDYCGYRDG